MGKVPSLRRAVAKSTCSVLELDQGLRRRDFRAWEYCCRDEGHAPSVALRAVLRTARETLVSPAFQEGQN